MQSNRKTRSAKTPVCHYQSKRSNKVSFKEQVEMVYRRRKRSRVAIPRAPKEITWGQFASKAWSGVQQIRKLINVETHRSDVSFASAINNTGSLQILNGVAIGDTSATRTGSSILSKEVCLRFATIKHASGTATVMRIVLFIDKRQIADTAPAVTDVLASADVMSHLQADNYTRYKVLKDWTVTLDTDDVIRCFMHKASLTDLHCGYNGTAASDINANGIYLLMLSNESTNTPSISGISRYEFYDN